MSLAGLSPKPATPQGRLPSIEHPLSRLGDVDRLDVRGAGERPPPTSGSRSGRPLAAEASYAVPKRISLSQRGSRDGLLSRSLPDGFDEPPPSQLDRRRIPDGVAVVAGDPNKTRLPVFGSQTPLGGRDELASRAAARLSRSSVDGRVDLDEIEMLLKEKCRNSYPEMQKRFRDNDPQGRGNVSREALARIFTTVTNRPITGGVFLRLLDRLGFADRQVVSFTEFFAKFRDSKSSEYPRWMDMKRDYALRDTLTASQVHALLKERAKSRIVELTDFIPQVNPGGARRLLKPEFRNALNKMGFFMDDGEYDKLWAKYDPEEIGAIDGVRLLKKLGITIEGIDLPRTAASSRKADSPSPVHSPRKKEVDRQRSVDIEKWLKNKFREGFISMKAAFEAADAASKGTVSRKEFVQVINDFGLRLKDEHLDEFLSRCSIQPKGEGGISYRDFLFRFQDRSEEGMAHKILSNSKHRYNRSEGAASPGAKSTLSALEANIINLFQHDFLSLIGTFHKIDRIGTDNISQEEFRAAVESKLGVEMTDDQFRALIDNVPLTTDGNVKYADFMAQFDTRAGAAAPSLFEGGAEKGAAGEVGSSYGVDRLVVSHDPFEAAAGARRAPDELYALIKGLLVKDYQSFERAFQDMEEYNSQRMSQETLYNLLRKFKVTPEVSRGEIRELWSTLITNSSNKLEYLQFLRHFGASSHDGGSHPSSKLHPPVKGDSDLMLRSRKMNSDSDLLHDSLRQKVDYMWDELRKEFIAMDAEGTGCVATEQFRAVLTELCVHLSDFEQDLLARKFTVDDGRVSYVEFLKPFAQKRQIWRHGNNMLALMQHPRAELPVSDIVEPPHKGLFGLTSKLRDKLAGDWKNLRRAFKKLDKTGDGYLSLPEFRSVLKLANVVMDEDDVYHIMQRFDENLTGKIAYNRFLNETFQRSGQKDVAEIQS